MREPARGGLRPQTLELRRKFQRAVTAAGGDKVVAQLLGCSRSYVGMIIHGDRRPGLITAYGIERLCGITMQEWAREEIAAAAAAAATSQVEGGANGAA